MALVDTVILFRDREGERDPLKATWYLVATAALTGAGAGSAVPSVYRAATNGLPLELAKLVQRRLKEAILKSTIFVGVPRSAGAAFALFRDLSDEEIDHYGPRFESYDDPEEQDKREARGKKFFDILWTPIGAEGVRATLKKYQPDFCRHNSFGDCKYHADAAIDLLNQRLIYEYWGSEDRILKDVETELVAIASLVAMNCPEQLVWHLKGAIRHGATRSQAQFAYDLGIAASKAAGCELSGVPKWEDFHWETPNSAEEEILN
ncbi:uncharacterized protein A1O5_12515 [Cladophialophora psammophila CBS 110553]|uniref:Carboxymuconolactone decarboxylase-like domain-containing protein n=1 Tax=Cladophialophora psammophila CBS 110553 TaxID=1182543 RepID=W9VYC8_9EURO|nr:uncharacterized protein A1O5_12515 [Cladophialophora psammophila CBS 110553]EXJ57725.1 hypothetical protein A1O5_12515 [Cladophialophora psammophila CBS 110553]